VIDDQRLLNCQFPHRDHLPLQWLAVDASNSVRDASIRAGAAIDFDSIIARVTQGHSRRLDASRVTQDFTETRRSCGGVRMLEREATQCTTL